MGLDTTHGCYNGGYIAFNNHRRELARIIGMDLMEMKGFGGNIPWPEGHKHQDVFPLLSHSDCDGILDLNECKQVYVGLVNIRSEYALPESLLDFVDNWIVGLGEAIDANETVEFG